MTKSLERLTARQRAAVHRVASELAADEQCGGCVVVTGAPGTGKTLAANVLGHQLAWPLYRVDMGLVVSKYIGETERNINRLFEDAERNDTILLFDEVDALFGKRTDAEDAHDRYANLETSYPLLRLAQYPGVVVLASNSADGLDPVVVRRARIVIDLDDAPA